MGPSDARSSKDYLLGWPDRGAEGCVSENGTLGGDVQGCSEFIFQVTPGITARVKLWPRHLGAGEEPH